TAISRSSHFIPENHRSVKSSLELRCVRVGKLPGTCEPGRNSPNRLPQCSSPDRGCALDYVRAKRDPDTVERPATIRVRANGSQALSHPVTGRTVALVGPYIPTGTMWSSSPGAVECRCTISVE